MTKLLRIASIALGVTMLVSGPGYAAPLTVGVRERAGQPETLVNPGFEELFAAWSSRAAGRLGKRAAIQAAAARESDVRSAMEALSGSEDERRQEFSVYVLAARRSTAAFDALVSAVQAERLSSKVRAYSLMEVESLSGKDLLPALDPDSVDYNQPFEARLQSVLAWIRSSPPLVDGREVNRGAEILGNCLREFSVRRSNPAAPVEDLDSYFNCLQLHLELLSSSRHPKEAADSLVRHLEQLLTLPYQQKFEDADGKLLYQTLFSIQGHIGPVDGLAPGGRANIEPIASAVIDWWRTAEQRSPTEWRMERLARAGYRTGVGQDGLIVGVELLRAVRGGTAAESTAAADVLMELGLTSGTVPLIEDGGTVRRSTAGAVLVGTVIRAQVAMEASASMVGGRLPIWDSTRACWMAGLAR